MNLMMVIIVPYSAIGVNYPPNKVLLRSGRL